MNFKRFKVVNRKKEALSAKNKGKTQGDRLAALETAMVELLEILSTHGLDAHEKAACSELQTELTGEAPAKRKGVY